MKLTTYMQNMNLDNTIDHAIFELKRRSNSYCWMYGVLTLNDEWLADTLEFGESVALPDGDYYLHLSRSPLDNSTVIEICDFMQNVVSELCTINVYNSKNVIVRNYNNKISIGCKTGNSLLTMPEFQFRLLRLSIYGEIQRGCKCILRISGGKDLINV